jgi:DNA (cytosine-5)-methyltransferase 1
MKTLKVLDLFSGIGGFSLGLERAGMETVAFCEIEEFPRKVLAKHWPGIPIYEDVRNVTKEKLLADAICFESQERRNDKTNEGESYERRAHARGSGSNDRRKHRASENREDGNLTSARVSGIDVITGGFPCQDISVAGKQAGIDGERSGLWSECARILGEFRPRYAIFENVTALISGERGKWFERVLWDISEVGYDAEWHCIPASELGAHHHRDRVWIVAYPQHDGHPSREKRRGTEAGAAEGRKEEQSVTKQPKRGSPQQPLSNNVADAKIGTNGLRFTESLKRQKSKLRESLITAGGMWSSEPDLGRVAHGIPDRSHRLKGLGNAVVPQIPELIGRAILEAEQWQ